MLACVDDARGEIPIKLSINFVVKIYLQHITQRERERERGENKRTSLKINKARVWHRTWYKIFTGSNSTIRESEKEKCYRNILFQTCILFSTISARATTLRRLLFADQGAYRCTRVGTQGRPTRTSLLLSFFGNESTNGSITMPEGGRGMIARAKKARRDFSNEGGGRTFRFAA